MRLPSDGGGAMLLRGDSLTPLDWSIESGIPAIARGLGTDLEEKIVYAVDTRGRLIGIDLYAQRTRTYLAAADELVSAPDGTIYGLDSAGRALRFAGRSLTTFRASLDAGPTTLLRAPGAQVAAVSKKSGVIQVIGDEGEVRRIEAPAGKVAATWFGDMIAVTTDSGVLFVDPRGKPAPYFAELEGSPQVATFSPSGHRLYVARSTNDIVILAPIAQGSSELKAREVGTVALPGAAAELRMDQSGRWLLARPAKGDSVWLLDVVRRERLTTVRTRWAADLPLVSGGRTLVSRDGRDVVAWDITGSAPVERSRLVGAGGDVFMVVPWAPASAVPPAELARVDTVTETPDSASAQEPDTTVPPLAQVPDSRSGPEPPAPAPSTAGGPMSVYLQVSSSQNVDWARAFSDQLRQGGFPSRVLEPGSADEGYRVVVGPYATREEADAAGRRLGRPYFIITAIAGGT